MSDVPVTRQARLESFLGRMGVDRGLITPDQLREALEDQAGDAGRGMKSPRPLGAILVAKGYLTDRQLVALLEAQQTQTVGMNAFQRQDRRLGQILIHRGDMPPALVNECLRLQAEAIEEGQARVPRLGEIIVANGYASIEAIRKALEAQKKVILVCGDCGKRYNVAGFDAKKVYACPACRRPLRLPASPPPTGPLPFPRA